MGRKKLANDKKKVKINITIDAYQLEILKAIGPTVSEVIRKIIDEKLRDNSKEISLRKKRTL